VTLGLLGALAAAVCYGVGSILQSVGSRRLATTRDLDPRLLFRLLRQLPYVGGLALDLLGFAASVLALRTLPLFLVQSAVAASIGVTAVLASRLLHVRLSRRESVALGGLAAGLVLLALSAQSDSAVPLSMSGRWLVLTGVPVVTLLGAVSARLHGAAAATGLALAAGLGFGGVGVAARVLALHSPLWTVVRAPEAYALAGYGLLGTLLFATALQRGSVTTTSALAFAVETLVPAAIGLAWLGDSARPGFGVVAAAGFALTLAGAISLARYAEVDAAAPTSAPPPSP
jgi:hypothetical protein